MSLNGFYKSYIWFSLTAHLRTLTPVTPGPIIHICIHIPDGLSLGNTPYLSIGQPLSSDLLPKLWSSVGMMRGGLLC
jgi:hypothetical protein